ncbi:hypothetical protein SCLCIDRAFT_615029 [Scleroderma citrinum Foug A]|uniref:Uncharacterized protein n=1 Tax=Scleroderma citrinum Foug A TaxID=1036808 RepID=A0A0C3DVU6_9AGAM|nr:hypothetical protein SCLCIDRAFT_615029 [Scleroderma citrinum Foug A]
MLRHGMLSPNSKLLPQPSFGVDPTSRMSIVSDVSQLSSASFLSNASNLSLSSNISTSSKHLKDARDTPKRRTRHRDGKLLKGGIGLTTGLGWSDSEDEDAPSALTRRLSRLVLTRRTSSSSIQSFRSCHSQPYSSHPLSRSISHSVLREVDELEGGGPSTNPIGTSLCPVDEFGCTNGVASRSLPSRSGSRIVSRSGSTHSTGSGSGSRYSNYSTMSAPAASLRTRASSGSSSYEAMSRANSFSYRGYNGQGLALSIPEQDDGVTPTRAAFERASLGAVGNGNGTQGSGESPHTPSSTASSTSLSFPATPDSTDIAQIDKKSEGQPVGVAAKAIMNKDKSLPPLPPSGIPSTLNGSGMISKGKFPSSLGLKAPSGLQRPRTYSNASSVSTHSVVGPGADGSSSVPAGGHNMSRSPSTTPGSPSATSRPSIGGPSIPRPSLGIPRPSLSSLSSAVGSLPRPSLTLSSIKLPSSAPASTATSPLSPLPAAAATGNGQGPMPRPLKLVSPRSVTSPSVDSPRSYSPFLSRTPTPGALKSLEPGERLPRPGQVLTYNRNLHDQLKLRALSPSSGIPSAKIGPVSPGGTQTLVLPQGSSSPGSSPLSSPTTGDSPRPKPRTGTGMVYRTNGTSRIRVPSTPARP